MQLGGSNCLAAPCPVSSVWESLICPNYLCVRAVERTQYTVREVGELGKKPDLQCPKHGVQPFYRETYKGHSRYRCSRCNADAIWRRKQKLKAELVEEAGGGCTRCGYSTSVSALHFHHKDRMEKTFNLGQMTSFGKALVHEEAKKCILLCANCHAEVEDELRGPLA